MPYLPPMEDERREWFWKQFPGLVWSNSKASDTVMIRAALTRPYESRLETIGWEFGLERLRQEWVVLCADQITPLSVRHIALVSDMLDRIETTLKNAPGIHREIMAGPLVET
jgi:hypothetical protein